MKTLIKNAKQIDGKLVNILINDGVIISINNNINERADVVFDANGCFDYLCCWSVYGASDGGCCT